MELLYFGSYLSRQQAHARLQEAFRALGTPTTQVTRRTVDTADDAGFRGSRTVLASGRDQFARPGGRVGPDCRRYPDGGGGDRSPAVQRIQAVLADAG
ncbi:MAG TPA: hypothetical protein VK586_23915 [Streptosporangiaceae bacterium]|nr:hypothetical protein [Streptosporangiaceae bacterium]